MANKESQRGSFDVNEITSSHIKCPSCRFGNLVQSGLNKWECSSCGYWTVHRPANLLQTKIPERAGGYTPRSAEQQEAMKRGREYWGKLVSVSKKAIFGFLITFSILAFSLNLAVRTAMVQSLSLSWTIAAWVTAGFLGIVSLLLFASSSGKEKVAFVVILFFFIATGAFWFDLARTIARI